MTLAKGLSSAYVPLSATIVRKPIADFFEEDNLFCHGQTYANHPFSCAAGLATIEEYEKLDLIKRAKKMGDILGKGLKDLMARHESVGDVRGKGLFWGIEPVKNRETKEPFATRRERFEPTILNKMAAKAMENGVYFMTVINTMIISPPLTITEQEIEEGINVIDEVLKIADLRVKNRN
jgi:taurine--2-oxoglutarate transaminase